MRKICFFASDPNEIGGGEMVESYLIEKLISNSISVTVLAPRTNKTGNHSNLKNEKLEIIPIKMRKYPALLSMVVYAYLAKKMYYQIAKSASFDLLISFGPLSLAPALIKINNPDEKYAVFLHAAISDEMIPNIDYRNIPSLVTRILSLIPMSLIEYFYLRKSALVFVNSHYTAKNVFKTYRIDKTKIKVAYGAVDTSFFTEKSPSKVRDKHNIKSSPVILFVGRLAVKRKGFKYLLRAMPFIKQKIGDVKLVVVGGGPLRKKYEKQTKAMELDDAVIFVGSVKKEDLPYYYSSADLFVLPSIQEGLGLVILEAMACKTPVIASCVGGVPEIIRNGYSGILVPPRNAKKLADEIIKLLKDKEKAKLLAMNGYEFVRENYEWNALLDDMYIKINAINE